MHAARQKQSSASSEVHVGFSDLEGFGKEPGRPFPNWPEIKSAVRIQIRARRVPGANAGQHHVELHQTGAVMNCAPHTSHGSVL